MKKWLPYSIGGEDGLFIVDKGTGPLQTEISKGDNIYLSSTTFNNGIADFCNSEATCLGNKITVSDFGKSFYQKSPFQGTHITVLTPKDNIDENVLKLICSSIDKSTAGIYSFTRPVGIKRFSRQKIILPVDNNNKIDYNYLNQIYKKKTEALYSNIIKFLKKELTSIGKFSSTTLSLDECEWKSFKLYELFDEIQRGKRLIKDNQIEGNMPYISSTSLNNGIDNFISNDTKVRIFEDCISLANSGSVGSSFYEPYKFVASDHVTHLKNSNYNKYHYLFISTMLNRISSKYNFNREINDKRISREMVLLPINKKGELDLDYMENYIKNILSLKYSKVISFLEKNYGK